MVVKDENGQAAGALELEPQITFYVGATRRSRKAHVDRLSTTRPSVRARRSVRIRLRVHR